MKSSSVVVEELLNDVLRDTWIEEVQLSNIWCARFSNDLWLVAHELEFSAERAVRSLLSSSAPSLLSGVDANDVPKMTCLCALMRDKIRYCRIDESGSLSISFERGGELRATAGVPIVDWMWSVASSPGDPYRIPSIAYCLSAGAVEVGTLSPPDPGTARHEA